MNYLNDKPILCFHIGYVQDINNENMKTAYGSEIALWNLSKHFLKKYRVIVFGDVIYHEITKNGIEYLNSDKFEEFQNNNSIEIFIISRYIFPLLELNIRAKKIFLWIHDILPMTYYKNTSLFNNGKPLIKNLINKIDGIITLSNWHKNLIKDFYEIDDDKIFIIGNAIDPTKFKEKIKKQKNKFIWTSHGYRGIELLIEYFPEIRKRIPDAELYIYRDRTAFSDEVFNEILKYDYIHYCGKIENDELIKEFQSSDIWFYPTHFEESYCISALEAQMAKCVCISTNLAALPETIGDRGILITEPLFSIEYKEKAINEIVKILNDNELKIKIQEKGYNWAIKQTWQKRANEWYKLFNKNLDLDFLEIGTSDIDTMIQDCDDNSIGISIEPIKYYLDKLPNKKYVKKFNIAITGDKINKKTQIYYIPFDTIIREKLPLFFRGCNKIGEYHPLHIEFNIQHLVKIEDVDIINIGYFLNKNKIRKIKRLKIDTEGYELNILDGLYEYISNLSDEYHPNEILFESNTSGIKFFNDINAIINKYSKIGYNLEYSNIVPKQCTDTLLKKIK